MKTPRFTDKPLHWAGYSKKEKKSPSGIRTASTDVELIRERLKLAKSDYEVRYGKNG